MARKRRRRPRWWLTPRVWHKACSFCGGRQSAAFRYAGRGPGAGPMRYACSSCVKERGIRAKESRAYREGGSRAGSAVKVSWVDPATLLGQHQHLNATGGSSCKRF